MIPSRHTIEQLWMGLEQTVVGWSRALELSEREPAGHTYRVAETSLLLARKLGMSMEEQVDVVWGALLHDVGMLGVPESIIQKPGKLDVAERTLLEQHPNIARQLLSPIEILNKAAVIPYYHHERFNGTGYPNRLVGEEIPLAARLFAIADVWDALNFDQPFRPAWKKEDILEHLVDNKGKHFDPDMVDAFISLVEEGPVNEILVRKADLPSLMVR